MFEDSAVDFSFPYDHLFPDNERPRNYGRALLI